MEGSSRFAVAAFVLAGALFASHAHARDATDAAAVRAVVLQQADAWNRHDAAAYSALFTPDCDVVNIVGWWWKSRAEMQAKLTRAFSSVFRDSTLTFTDTQVKFLTPGIAVAHASWKMTGMRMPPGMPPPDQGIQTLVLTLHDGKWRIAEFQNTLSKPQHPFPTAPQTARSGSR
ncbi:MAG TPA: SgcJ/EcaC family oxidoreductase [Rhodanobacteraceae bacterium]|nr:SgcJ/EcaC family oxidoreductase [Rhodanobacteraceae bacterium]